ncbi:MAG: hypothetical protein EOO56_05315 [Hymenobacter sp.]|nr:MAG: hypothetical protein EOO56_05315 [Hymenobacter sp.]
MATGFDHVLNTPQTAIGKGKVGEPPTPPDGRTGVIIRVAIFFDGTKNNRNNTAKRLNDKTGTFLKIDDHGEDTSYGNYYSNPAIHEFMNNRNNLTKHEVSHYVEGIGTRNFVDGATEKESVEVEVRGSDEKLKKGETRSREKR